MSEANAAPYPPPQFSHQMRLIQKLNRRKYENERLNVSHFLILKKVIVYVPKVKTPNFSVHIWHPDLQKLVSVCFR